MISTNNPVPEVNFWEELVTKVQEIGQRTREQVQMPHISGEKSIRKHRFSRFEVQEAWHRSQEQTKVLANRIKYIEIQKQRHNRTLDLARKKYERMMEIRERSLKEKDEFRKRIIQVNEEQSKQAGERVLRMKEDRSRTSHSVQRVREKNELDARQIRELTDQFEEAIRQDREIEVEQKKVQVGKTRETMERSRMKLSQLHGERIKQGKLEHKESIRRQLEVNLQQHRRNSLLRQKLEESIVIALDSKKEKLTMLQQYQTIMTPSHSSRTKQISLIRSN